MKLAIICRPLSSHGGVETATAGLMRELLRRGHAIDLISTTGQEDFPGARVLRLATLRHPSLLRLLSFALAARRAVRRRDYDIVQSHERCLLQDIYRAGEGTHRGYLEAMGRLPQVNPYHQAVFGLEQRIFSLISARHIVAISRRGKAEIEGLYGTPGNRVSLVYNGVDLERFNPDNRRRLREPTREELGLGRKAWVALFVGSGFERKGLAPLLDGISRLRDRGSRLVVAGKGRAEPYQRLARGLGLDDRVLWLGPQERVERLYAAADVVALPALYEPFGNVHLEALASGVPILSSPRAGGSELITNGVNGWVVSDVSGESIALGLTALRESDAGAVSRAARKSAEPFTHAAQADAFETIYRRLAR